MTSPEDVRTVVTLVHGTWAKHAEWVDPERSELASVLGACLRQPVVIRKFPWSGRNSPKARYDASQALAKQLRADVDRHGNADHFVVAHSHGGNVALQALDLGGLGEEIAGVACLATPFLSVRPRNLGPGGRGLVVVAPMLWAVFGTLILADQYDVAWYVESGLIFAVLMPLFALYTVWHKMIRNLKTWMTFTPPPAERIRILRFGGDEASAALLASQFVADVTTRLLTLLATRVAKARASLNRRREHPSILLTVAAVLAVLGGLSMVMTRWLLPDETAFSISKTIGFLGLIFVLLYVFPYAVTIYQYLLAFIAVPIAVLLSVLLLPFGLTVALTNLALDVTAEVTPPGTWTVHQLEEGEGGDEDAGAPPLAHSAIYESEFVFNDLCTWMTARSAARTAG